MPEGIDHTTDPPPMAFLYRMNLAGPAATAFANIESGSGIVKSILTDPPPSDSGLKLPCSGDSSLNQNSAPSMDSRDTTAPSALSMRKTSLAPNADL
jgi:hypothetical protein